VKLTNQGVRDLDSLPGKSLGKKYEMPPVSVDCKHPPERIKKHRASGNSVCTVCNQEWDWQTGQPV